jgi:hypothetical protein
MVGIDWHRSAMIGQRMRSDHNDWHASVVCRVGSSRVRSSRVRSSRVELHACIRTSPPHRNRGCVVSGSECKQLWESIVTGMKETRKVWECNNGYQHIKWSTLG